MADILMVAPAHSLAETPASFETLFLTPEDFWQREELVKAYDATLWRAFTTHGKYARMAHHFDRFVVAYDADGAYVASAVVVMVADKWLVEYVMADPDQQGRGAGSAVMSRIMTEAETAGAVWVILNCDPDKEGGKLPAFYGRFGFREVPTLAKGA